MEILIYGIVEDVNEYQGKNGFGCNVKLSQLKDKRRKEITLNTKNALIAKVLEKNLQEEVSLTAILEQTNFGLRLVDITNVEEDCETNCC